MTAYDWQHCARQPPRDARVHRSCGRPSIVIVPYALLHLVCVCRLLPIVGQLTALQFFRSIFFSSVAILWLFNYGKYFFQLSLRLSIVLTYSVLLMRKISYRRRLFHFIHVPIRFLHHRCAFVHVARFLCTLIFLCFQSIPRLLRINFYRVEILVYYLVGTFRLLFKIALIRRRLNGFL